MTEKIKIAVDAMGGENSPKKVVDGILENYKSNKDVIYNIFGDEEKVKSLLPRNFDNKIFNITNTKNKILDTDSPLSAAKKGKGDLIFGNIIGSNIYNLLLILGISSLFDNFKYSFMTLQLDVLIVTLLIIIFSVIFFKRITITTNFSVMCLATYILYLINLFYRNFWKLFTLST